MVVKCRGTAAGSISLTKNLERRVYIEKTALSSIRMVINCLYKAVNCTFMAASYISIVVNCMRVTSMDMAVKCAGWL